jgi:hypothetical protein
MRKGAGVAAAIVLGSVAALLLLGVIALALDGSESEPSSGSSWGVWLLFPVLLVPEVFPLYWIARRGRRGAAATALLVVLALRLASTPLLFWLEVRDPEEDIGTAGAYLFFSFLLASAHYALVFALQGYEQLRSRRFDRAV